MTQLIGLLVILNSLAITAWWVGSGRPHSAVAIFVCLIAVFAGVFLVLQERALEITVKGVGTIKAAAQQAVLDAQQVRDIRERMEAQRATVDLVAKEASDAKRLSEDLSRKNAEADQKLKTVDESVRKGQTAVQELQAYTAFNSTILAAQTDDRRAFDQLLKWTEDPSYPLSKLAAQAFATILDQHNPAMVRMGVNIPWKEGIDPSKLDLGELKAAYAAAPPYLRVDFIQFIWKREDIPKRDRMEFLVQVLRDEQSLTAVEYAGRFFALATQDKLKPLAIRQHLEWWEQNKDQFK